MRLRGYEATRLRGYEATRLRGYEATRLRGYEATRLRGYEATRLRGYARGGGLLYPIIRITRLGSALVKYDLVMVTSMTTVWQREYNLKYV